MGSFMIWGENPLFLLEYPALIGIARVCLRRQGGRGEEDIKKIKRNISENSFQS